MAARVWGEDEPVKRGGVRLLTAVLLLAFSFPALLHAQGESKGRIDWNQGYISAVGYGTADPSGNRMRDRMTADRVAVINAYRALSETINGVRVDAETSVGKMGVKEYVVRTRVDGLIKGAQVVKRQVEWAGDTPMVTVEMRICMSNKAAGCKADTSLISALELDRRPEPSYVPSGRYPIVPAVYTPDSPRPAPVPESKFKNYDPTKPVTGVIFYMEGRPFEKELLPVVITEKDNERMTVYSVKTVKPAVVRTHGVIRYADTLDQGMQITHLGNNILVLPVARVTENNMIMIDEDATRMIRETTRYDNNYLSEAKVAIAAN
jgi:hypothetical protein